MIKEKTSWEVEAKSDHGFITIFDCWDCNTQEEAEKYFLGIYRHSGVFRIKKITEITETRTEIEAGEWKKIK